MNKITLGKIDSVKISPAHALFSIRRRGVGLAVGHLLARSSTSGSANSFVVLRGSRISAMKPASLSAGYLSLRENLIKWGVVAKSKDGALRFTQDWIFDSPSAAACVVLASSANGNDEWLLV